MMVCRAFLVREASEVVRSECACCGRLICLRLYNRSFGIAFHGPLVSSCSAFASCLSVSKPGATKEAFQEMMGKDCWLYREMEGRRPSPKERILETEEWIFLMGAWNCMVCAPGPMSMPR